MRAMTDAAIVRCPNQPVHRYAAPILRKSGD
jgi:hypothetical protein